MIGERVWPKEENLGRDCQFWDVKQGCCYPKIELLGRRSCEGIIDSVCLFVKDGRPANDLSDEQIIEIKTRVPNFQSSSKLPPGETR